MRTARFYLFGNAALTLFAAGHGSWIGVKWVAHREPCRRVMGNVFPLALRQTSSAVLVSAAIFVRWGDDKEVPTKK